MMDYETYKKNFYADPPPKPHYNFTGAFGSTLYYEDYQAALVYYERVLGPPAYVEGAGTRGWRIGGGWLTLFQGKSGNPTNVEITFVVATPEEAETLQRAFIEAGGEGPAPSDELMYEPIRFCAVTDPFGVGLLIISPINLG
jgi:hypothetical protein